jgi:hypothetical protein
VPHGSMRRGVTYTRHVQSALPVAEFAATHDESSGRSRQKLRIDVSAKYGSVLDIRMPTRTIGRFGEQLG